MKKFNKRKYIRVHTPLNEEEQQKAASLRREGLSYKEIGERLNKHLQQIARYCTLNNIKPKNGDARCSIWSTKLIEKLIECYSKCKRMDEVCKEMDLPRSVIASKASSLRGEGVFVPYLQCGRPTKRATNEHGSAPECTTE